MQYMMSIVIIVMLFSITIINISLFSIIIMVINIYNIIWIILVDHFKLFGMSTSLPA